MTSGIYEIKFPSGAVYIGQSVDIENRWEQHYDKFCKVKHSVAMQREFNKYKEFDAKILFTCHPTHLDMMEAAYIHAWRTKYGSMCLNTTIPKDIPKADLDLISSNEYFLDMSVPDLIREVLKSKTSEDAAKSNMFYLQKSLDTLEDRGIVLPEKSKEIQRKNKELQSEIDKLKLEVKRLSVEANKTWWQRLWS